MLPPPTVAPPPAPLRRPALQLDITCDGCEAEPIEGERFKCTVCEDIDLCARCTRALVAARVKMAAEAGGRLSVAPPIEQVPRPRRWVAKLHSKDASAKWAALQTAVPCLSHRFARVDSGPERQVVFVGPGSPAPAGTSKGGSTAAAAAAAEHAGAGDAGAESGAAEVESKLQEFLQDFLPSATSCEDLAWICVSAPQQRHQQQQAGQQREQQQAVQRQEEQQAGPQHQPRAARAAGQPEAAAAAPSSAGAEQAAAALQQVQLKALEERVDAAVEEFEQLVAQRPPTAEDVDGLARKHAILKAKVPLRTCCRKSASLEQQRQQRRRRLLPSCGGGAALAGLTRSFCRGRSNPMASLTGASDV